MAAWRKNLPAAWKTRWRWRPTARRGQSNTSTSHNNFTEFNHDEASGRAPRFLFHQCFDSGLDFFEGGGGGQRAAEADGDDPRKLLRPFPENSSPFKAENAAPKADERGGDYDGWGGFDM